MVLIDPRLQALTDKFLTEFLEMAHVIRQEEENKGLSQKRDDSFNFNYTLAEGIYESAITKELTFKDDFHLMGSGFVQNIIKGFLNNSIQGFSKEMQLALDNYDKQEEYADYRMENLTVIEETRVENEMEITHEGGLNITWVPTPNIYITKSFKTVNTKSGHDQLVDVIYKNGEMKNIVFRTLRGESMMNIDVNKRVSDQSTDDEVVYYTEETATVHGYKHVAEINGAFSMIYQVAHFAGE